MDYSSGSTNGCERRGVLKAMKEPCPKVSERKYDRIRHREGRPAAHAYRRYVNKKRKTWTKRNATCYDVLVKSCLYCVEAQTVWMDNKGVSAQILKEKLDARFVPKTRMRLLTTNLDCLIRWKSHSRRMPLPILIESFAPPLLWKDWGIR